MFYVCDYQTKLGHKDQNNDIPKYYTCKSSKSIQNISKYYISQISCSKIHITDKLAVNCYLVFS